MQRQKAKAFPVLTTLWGTLLAAGNVKIAVLAFSASGVDQTVAAAVTESVTAEIAVRGYFDPMSSGEVQTLLGVERQKALLGCGEENCMAELAGALGAPYVMSGSLVRLEGVFQLNLQVINSRKARTTGRSTKLATEAHAYIDAQLDAQKPVMVGVAWRTPSPGFNGGNADHYVVITGRGADADGRQFYTFHDPGSKTAVSGADTCPKNRIYVDETTGMLFRPGLQLPPGQMYTSDARYEVSQVRKNQ